MKKCSVSRPPYNPHHHHTHHTLGRNPTQIPPGQEGGGEIVLTEPRLCAVGTDDEAEAEAEAEDSGTEPGTARKSGGSEGGGKTTPPGGMRRRRDKARGDVYDDDDDDDAGEAAEEPTAEGGGREGGVEGADAATAVDGYVTVCSFVAEGCLLSMRWKT